MPVLSAGGMNKERADVFKTMPVILEVFKRAVSINKNSDEGIMRVKAVWGRVWDCIGRGVPLLGRKVVSSDIEVSPGEEGV